MGVGPASTRPDPTRPDSRALDNGAERQLDNGCPSRTAPCGAPAPTADVRGLPGRGVRLGRADSHPDSASRVGPGDVSCSGRGRRAERLGTVEIIQVARHEPETLFNAGFWLECEREAGRVLRTLTGVDDR